MTTRMLINAQRTEQVRVAVVEGNDLKDYQVEIADKNLCRGNIYRGIVANIQPSLAAAFIDIGEDRHGFLPVADVQPEAYHKQPPKGDAKRPRIDQVLERGKPILVQATKDSGGTKGAALSANVALAGRYLVLTPFDEVSGISRKAEDDKSRKTIRKRLAKLNLPDGHGVIVRTNGLEQNQTTLTRDLNALLRMWKKVNAEYGKGRGPRLLYSDQDLIVQALRDYLDSKIAEVIVDDDDVFDKANTYMRAFMPRSKTRLIRYRERLPLFTRYGLEQQIDGIYQRRSPLPSGGSLVIDGTEALTAIDVNSGRATQRGNHDESILSVNIEAAKEVARQLRLRDIGGLVVIDFIDMRTRKHQSKLEKTMRDAMKVDKARYSVGRISPNGLLEINRQRIKQALHQRTQRPCPTCHGAGSIPSPEFAAANLLGRLEARVAPGMIEKATVAVHPEIADALQNHYRARLVALEQELELQIEVISATNFHRTDERIDYQQREKAVVPKTVPALTSSDLATEDPQKLDNQGDEPVEKEKRPRKRRRRRKSAKAKEKENQQAADNKTAESESPDKSDDATSDDTAPDKVAADAAGNGKPSRTRRRRRGGRRNRKKAPSEGDQPAPAQPPATPADTAPPADAAPPADFIPPAVPPAPAFDDANDWNVGMFNDALGPAGATPAASDAEKPEPKKRQRRKPTAPTDGEAPAKPRRRRRTAKPTSDETQPTGKDAWQSPLAMGQDTSEAPPARRSPLRRDRSTLRWQWWGGDSEEPTVPEPPAIKSSDEP
ncbi:MAG: Rne/Rng family ribonuclease [Acidobacteriota bacterium]